MDDYDAVRKRRPNPHDPPRSDFSPAEERLAREEGFGCASDRWQWMQDTENYCASVDAHIADFKGAFRQDMEEVYGPKCAGLSAMSRAWALIPRLAAPSDKLIGDYDNEGQEAESQDEEGKDADTEGGEDDEWTTPLW